MTLQDVELVTRILAELAIILGLGIAPWWARPRGP
jgi:hypothetical protein